MLNIARRWRFYYHLASRATTDVIDAPVFTVVIGHIHTYACRFLLKLYTSIMSSKLPAFLRTNRNIQRTRTFCFLNCFTRRWNGSSPFTLTMKGLAKRTVEIHFRTSHTPQDTDLPTTCQRCVILFSRLRHYEVIRCCLHICLCPQPLHTSRVFWKIRWRTINQAPYGVIVHTE